MAYISLDELKQYLKIDATDTDNDDLLNASISSAQDRVEEICHRKFEASTDTVRYFDFQRDVRERTVYFDTDLISITGLEIDDETIPETDYRLEPRNIQPAWGMHLKKHSGSYGSYDFPEDRIKITGKWAFSETPPESVKFATKRLAAFYFRESDSQLFQTIGPQDQGQIQLPANEPSDVRAILKPFIRRYNRARY